MLATKLRRFGIALAAMVILALAPAIASAVNVDVGDGAGTVGDTVTVAVTVDDVTGLGIYAYELRITWPATRATIIAAPETGTLTDPWGPVTLNAAPGALDIAAAGAQALAGAGTLIDLTFVLGPSSGSATLSLAEVTFNEGSPAATASNGSLAISAPPAISISPNAGEILVGDSLLFSTSGGTPPYTYTSSNAGTAVFGGTDYLKGIAPGAVFAASTDDNGLMDVTTGQILIRAVALTVGAAAGMPLDTVEVPVTVTDPSAFDIRAAQFSVTYDENYLTAIDANDTGTIAAAAGWVAPVTRVGYGVIDISLAGANALAGPGALVNLRFVVDPGAGTAVRALTATAALFNEVYPALEQNGSINITGFATINVNPDMSTIVVGDQLQFSVSGATQPPLEWDVDDAGVASIDASGLLTATAAGETRVFVTDDVGATDTTDVITVCDLYVVIPDDTATTYTTLVPVAPDRPVTGMGIYGFEMTLTFNSATVRVADVTSAGTSSAAWGEPIVNTNITGRVIIVHAGSQPLSGSLPFVYLSLEPLGAGSTNLSISELRFNEGDPCALAVNGSLLVPTGIEIPGLSGATLDQNIPNPFNPSTVIRYGIADPGRVTVRIYDASGRLVRDLVDDAHAVPGAYVVRWDGTNDEGRRVASGVYFYRLDSAGTTRVRKMVVLK